MNPAQSLNLVENSEIRCVGIFIAALEIREVNETHQTRAVTHRDENNIRVLADKRLAVVERVGGAAPAVGAAVEEYHDRLIRPVVGAVHPYVEIKAVLALRIV